VPTEIPIPAADPLAREWAIVCEAPRFAACLVGLQRPPDGGFEQRFETIWTIERPIVREATRVRCELVGRFAPQLADLSGRFDDPLLLAEEDWQTVIELTTRMVQYAVEG